LNTFTFINSLSLHLNLYKNKQLIIFSNYVYLILIYFVTKTMLNQIIVFSRFTL